MSVNQVICSKNDLVEEILSSLLKQSEISENESLKQKVSDLRTHLQKDTNWDQFFVHFEDVMFAQSSASLMLSQGGDQAFKEITSSEALTRPDLHNAIDILIHTPSLIQDLQDLNWDKYGWQTSGEGFEAIHLTTFFADLGINPDPERMINDIADKDDHHRIQQQISIAFDHLCAVIVPNIKERIDARDKCQNTRNAAGQSLK